MSKQQLPPENTEASFAMYGETVIDRPLNEVWSASLEFPFWFFSNKAVERLRGDRGEVGDTIVTNGVMRNEIVALRPRKSVTWKFSPMLTDGVHVIFYDLELAAENRQTRLSMRYFSQRGWPSEMARQMLEELAHGKTPYFMHQVLAAFKANLETGITHEAYERMNGTAP